MIRFGRQLCGDLEEAARREWLVVDGLGGYAMGTVAGLRTRRYHGLLVVAARSPGSRMLGLASLDPVVGAGDSRVALAVHEWSGGAVEPRGHLHLESFEVRDGVPAWRWAFGDLVLEREVAMQRGRPLVAVRHRLLRARSSVRLDLDLVVTWRTVHGERTADRPLRVDETADGVVVESAYRVSGAGYRPGGQWWRDVHHRVEAERGLNPAEDLWHAGMFSATLEPGQTAAVVAWAGDLSQEPPAADEVIDAARERARAVARRASASDAVDQALAVAADQFITVSPGVIAGYPWFGEWSRDTMTAYEGLFLETLRVEEGRALLLRSGESLVEGMLPNTTDSGTAEYNTADATLWFLHAVGRHVEVTGDIDLAADLADALVGVIDHHLRGTRFGIGVDGSDGLLRQGARGLALTWMDARIDGHIVTPRAGKAVEVNALWINGCSMVAALLESLGRDSTSLRGLEDRARASFRRRFWRNGFCLDVIDGDPSDELRVRPNALIAVSLPRAPLRERALVERCAAQLLTSLGVRSLAPDDAEYRGRHRGGPADRDHAYHQGTVWPWLVGPYVEAALRTGVGTAGVLNGLEAHLPEWGVGSVSETAEGDAPHLATGCPFQAWSVAELLRARRLLQHDAERARLR